MKDDQGMWNFIFSLFFLAVFGAAVWALFTLGRLQTAITTFDFMLIILATFRVTRLFVYDKVTQFIRDWFVRKEVIEGDNGEIIIMRQNLARGPRRTIHELLSCPWCFGMWAGLSVSFFYYLTPLAWFPILVLAVSGAGSFIQILSNMVGWRAEHLKKKTEE